LKILLLNQCFYPDVVSTAQHLTDYAVELAARGHEVTVLASRRAYDDPGTRFPKREVWKGVNVIRIRSTGLGKGAKWRRALDFGSFLLSCFARLLFVPRQDVVVALTSPPLISFFGALFVRLKGGRFIFWVMDLNPDEAIAAGWLKNGSPVTKVLKSLLNYSLRSAHRIIVLDRFAARRIREKGIAPARIIVIPPWPHDDVVRYDEEGGREFRRAHNLADKFVVMYSGNHSPCHPLDTILEAARRLSNHPSIAFCFVGGGSEYQKAAALAVEGGLKNVVCLPYQPLDKLSVSLSAADLHVVVMGDEFVGIVHPCKIYNILTLGSPFIYVGPAESHVAELICGLGDATEALSARHGEGEKVAEYILRSARGGAKAGPVGTIKLPDGFSKKALVARLVETIEAADPKARAADCGLRIAECGMKSSRQ